MSRKREIINFLKTFGAIILFALIMTSLFNCKSKKLAVEKTKEEIKKVEKINIDSIFKTHKQTIDSISFKERLNYNKENASFGIDYLPVVDSMGRYQPFIYLEKKGKDTLHFISIKGNAIFSKNKNTESFGQNLSKINLTQKTQIEKTKVASKSEKQKDSKINRKEKEKEVTTTTTTFGTYAIVGLVALACIGLFWFFGLPRLKKKS